MPSNITQDELDLFHSYNLKDTEGGFSYDSYKQWYKDYVDSNLKETNKLKDIVEVMDHANQISLEATKDIPNIEKKLPINGLLTHDEVISFIVEKVDINDLKLDTKEMIKTILKDNPKKEETKKDTIKEEKKDQIDEIKKVLEPLFLKCSIDDVLPKNIEDELMKFFEEEGFDSTEIEEIFSKEEKDEPKEKKKETPYNPYNDWRYIYYMWTLGYDYSRFLFAKPKRFDELKGGALDEKKEKNAFNLKKKPIPKSLEKEYKALNKEYGFTIDLDELIEKLHNESYMEFYKNLITESYHKVKSNIHDSVTFISKMDDFIKKVTEFEKLDIYQPFGGMDNNQIRKLLVDLREPDCNYTLKVKNKLQEKFGDYENADSTKVFESMEKDFRARYYDAGFNPKRYKEYMSEAIATYNIAKKLHNIRGLRYKVFGRASYNQEEQALESMEALLNKEVSKEKREFINDALEKENLYKEGYKEEFARINDFSLELAKNSYEILDEPIEISAKEVNINEDKEVISEAKENVMDEIVRES